MDYHTIDRTQSLQMSRSMMPPLNRRDEVDLLDEGASIQKHQVHASRQSPNNPKQPSRPECREKKDIAISLRATNRAQILAIDRALQEIGDMGEIRLVVYRGRLRFLEKIKMERLPSEPVCA
jgi:hypothetical protein